MKKKCKRENHFALIYLNVV